MGRFQTLILGAAVAASVILATPAIATADPLVGATANGAPVANGDTGQIGQSLTLTGAGCTNPTVGQPSYFGMFVAQDLDPLTSSQWHPFEVQADTTGSFSLDVTIPTDNGTGSFDARWYCSSAPVDTINDPAMLWVSPIYSYNINALQSGARKTTTLKQGNMIVRDTTGTITGYVNADSLPAIDHIGIHGPEMAVVKSRVDVAYPAVAPIQRLYSAFLNRVANHAEMSAWVAQIQNGLPLTAVADQLGQTPQFLRSWGTRDVPNFVDAAYQNVLGHPADAAGRSYWIGQLNSGAATRARMVLALANSDENIARTADFTYASTAYQVLSTKTPEVAAVAAQAAHLTAGRIRVQVIEDIALSLNAKASYWMNAVDNNTLIVP